MLKLEGILGAVTLDWLQIYCHGTIQDSENYSFKILDYHTRQFNKVHEIYYKLQKIGVCTSEPCSRIINPKAIIIKFENSLLYTAALKHFVMKFLTETKIWFKSITRCDIARDFLKFSDGTHPQQFIRNFFSGEILKNGRGNFQAIGEQKSQTVYEYLKFGSPTTGRHIYLYNKSKELRDVKEKHHIRDFWKVNQLNTGADVWRIEFSFKGSKNKVIDYLSGELAKIQLADLFSFDKIYHILSVAISQLFSFKKNDGTKNKTRMEDILIFDPIDKTKKLVTLPDNEDSKRTQRVILKQLVKEFHELSKTKTNEAFFVEQSIKALATKYRLMEYVKKHLQFDFVPIMYLETL